MDSTKRNGSDWLTLLLSALLLYACTRSYQRTTLDYYIDAAAILLSLGVAMVVLVRAARRHRK